MNRLREKKNRNILKRGWFVNSVLPLAVMVADVLPMFLLIDSPVGSVSQYYSLNVNCQYASLVLKLATFNELI